MNAMTFMLNKQPLYVLQKKDLCTLKQTWAILVQIYLLIILTKMGWQNKLTYRSNEVQAEGIRIKRKRSDFFGIFISDR